ncbi:hypothetical protein [Bacillus thuringiensis]|nr:hypothetical protein [Bacillus thuringiensis]
MSISKYKIPSVNGEGWGVFLFDDTGIFTHAHQLKDFYYPQVQKNVILS